MYRLDRRRHYQRASRSLQRPLDSVRNLKIPRPVINEHCTSMNIDTGPNATKGNTSKTPGVSTTSKSGITKQDLFPHWSFSTHPHRNKVGSNKESSKQHLRYKENRKHFLSKLWVLNSTSEQHGKGGTCHCKSIANSQENAKAGLESNHQVRDKDGKKDLNKRDECLHSQACQEVRKGCVVISREFAKEYGAFFWKRKQRALSCSKL